MSLEALDKELNEIPRTRRVEKTLRHGTSLRLPYLGRSCLHNINF